MVKFDEGSNERFGDKRTIYFNPKGMFINEYTNGVIDELDRYKILLDWKKYSVEVLMFSLLIQLSKIKEELKEVNHNLNCLDRIGR